MAQRLGVDSVLVGDPGDRIMLGVLTDQPQAARRWWSIEELRHVEGDERYVAWLLFATTGVQESEVAGLTATPAPCTPRRSGGAP